MLLLLPLAHAQCSTWGPPTAVSTVRNLGLDEISGLAISAQHPGLGWVIEDSGNRPVVYGIDLESGKVVSRLHLAARNHDWEDVGLEGCSRFLRRL